MLAQRCTNILPNKLQKAFEIQEFEFVFRFVYDNHRKWISKSWENKDSKNQEVYNQMLDTWVAKFTELSF